LLTFEKVQVFVFETKDPFITSEMGGTSGFCTNKNCIIVLINVDTFTKGGLQNTITHELAHAINPVYDMENMSVGQGIVFEGLAENFRESMVDHMKSRLVSNVNEFEIEEMFNKIRPILLSKKLSDYHEVFFGTGKLPRWAGYSVGYYLVRRIIKDYKKIDWNLLLMQNPDIILNEILDFSSRRETK